ncbi:hypothetical protein IC766_12205 [Acinetobacter seifertii]|nr:hypothetical protein IC766_12205 [Acinetobacter seifertii]
MIGYNQKRKKGKCRKQAFLKGLMLLSSLHVPVVIYAAKPSEQYHTLKDNLSQLFVRACKLFCVSSIFYK